MPNQHLNPSGMNTPTGYSHVVKAGDTIYIAGQVARAPDSSLVGKDDPTAQAEVLAELGGIKLPPRPQGIAQDEAGKAMLDEIRMVDLTRQFAGPLGTTMMGYYGMEVIMVESEEAGNQGRDGSGHADMNRAKLGCIFCLSRHKLIR